MDAKTPTPAQMVAEYIGLRDYKKQLEDEYEAFLKANCTDRMEALEAELLDLLNKLGSDSISSPAGTVYKTQFVSVTTADMREFRRHIIGSEEWDLCDWKPNKTAINDLVDNKQPLPPGVNRTVIWKVNIRRK